MTKEEYELNKQTILTQFGKAEFDYDRTPLNESAKELNKLKAKYMLDIRAEKKLAKQKALEETSSSNSKSLVEATDSISEGKKKEYNKVQLPEIIVLDKDLKGFDSIQASILKDHFANFDIEPKTLANKYGKSYQYVAGLLKSKEVERLRTKYFVEVLNVETMKSVLRAVKAGDSRTIEASSEFLKLMSNSEENTGSKAIEDPEAEKKLKELGDTLSEF